MGDCCENEALELAALRDRQAGVLRVVLFASLTMFAIEFSAGIWTRSTALLGDSLDMLSDGFVYAFSLFVLHRSTRWRSSAALVKGLLMAGIGIAVLVEAGIRIRAGALPSAPAMATVGTLALATNALCFVLLYRHRADDANLRSTWLCTRNDLAANVAVLLAAAIVARTGSGWPDWVVGIAIACLFLRTSVTVVREALSDLSASRPQGTTRTNDPASRATSKPVRSA